MSLKTVYLTMILFSWFLEVVYGLERHLQITLQKAKQQADYIGNDRTFI